MKYRTSGLLCALCILLPGKVLADDIVLTGKRVLDKDTFISATTITFKGDALVVTNGFKLTLEGTKSITFEGTPRVISFELRDGRRPGDPGRSPGPVILQTPLLGGTSLRIEDVGEDGIKGADGTTGPQGPHGHQGTQRDWNPWNGCIGGSNGTPGGQGGDGGNGGSGGNGGTGGTIVFNVKTGFWNGTIARLDMVVTGGNAGSGGSQGAGGPGGQGGEGAPGNLHCGGTDPGPTGPMGRPGLAGVPGAPGNAGLIIDVNGNSLPTKLNEMEKLLYNRPVSR